MGRRSVQFRPLAPSERTFLSRKNHFREIAKLRKSLPKLREPQSPFLSQFCSVFSLGLPNALKGCVNALSFSDTVSPNFRRYRQSACPTRISCASPLSRSL